MKLSCALLLALAACVAANVLDPRGARPVVPNTRSEKCETQKDWPFCTDDQWGPKCPSGCRIHGLLEMYDHDFLKRIEKIRALLGQNQNKYRTTDQVSRQTYDYLREKLTLSSGLDNNYYDLAQTLRLRITEMKIKIDQQLQVLAALKDRVRDQVQDMKKLEVDIDMKLRTCKGSCKTYHSFEVDHDGHVALEKQMNQLDSLAGQSVETFGTLHVMKSRPLKDAVTDSIYKSKGGLVEPLVVEVDVFPEVKTMQLFLEMEGSSSSPATVSKVPVCLRLTQNGRQSLRGSDRRWGRCGGKADLPLCSDYDWVSRCPSGCRLQGLILQHEAELENRFRKICTVSGAVRAAAEKTMEKTAQVYHRSREDLLHSMEWQVQFVDGAEALSKNLTLLRKRSKSLETQAMDLRRKVGQQLEELQRIEVDVALRLRSCRGSCRSSRPFPVSLQDFAALRSQMEQVAPHASPPGDVPLIRTAPLDFGPEPIPVYKTIRTVLSEGLDLFEDLRPPRLQLQDGSE